MTSQFIPRDISWLSFNGRVLQEAGDTTNALPSRIKFLGIFSNNLDEFYRIRIAGLKRSLAIDEKEAKEIFFEKPQLILDEVNRIVIGQQKEFDKIWLKMQKEMAKQHVFIKFAEDLNEEQQRFVRQYYEDEVESNLIPLLLSDERPMPYLRDKSLYLGVSMMKGSRQDEAKFAIIEVPTGDVGRFIKLPSDSKEVHVILLEDIIKFNLPFIFSYFGFDDFRAHAFKITRDADFDLDNDINTTMADKIAKAVKNRRKGKPTRFVYDQDMDEKLVEYLIKKLNLSKKDSIIPGQKIHNFKHFMDFPDVFTQNPARKKYTPFLHPMFKGKQRITDVIIKQDVLLSLPYHTFTPVIGLLREAAMDPDVLSIKITAYRLAEHSKIGNVLINAARNGKEVTVMLELRARFDETRNLEWKERFETEGVKVVVGIPNKKAHAKLCIIRKRVQDKIIQYGFVSTGNFNEKTAKTYSDYCIMTSKKSIMTDINRLFTAVQDTKRSISESLISGKGLLFCPTDMRNTILAYLDKEITEAKAGRKAHIIIKINSLSDKDIIKKLYEAAAAGVEIEMIVRSIFCAVNQKAFKKPIHAISIVDEYLEHARVMYFYHAGKEHLYISSADWMTRNLDHRIEAAVRIFNKDIKSELLHMLKMQLKDNVKARVLNNTLDNAYVQREGEPFRSQVELYRFLKNQTHKS
ncbi:polyphosphate kinase 1 [Sphingobacterium sp. SGG-5]|uniref:polyphosphate kinase 1 n=1 Tax=Sphingobacterium sp. SGG-5 TaxID=2710881 RepID=UPI0013ECE7C4|nr:polyphosphate kinase 1 [Sphingobacterium sp. SGG-5]NGM61808.1 polyphosphate kinase 1 [Sphingobacterium sp. SGG-5]